LSVPWFPLVGAIIGLLLAGMALLCSSLEAFLLAVLLFAAEIVITGVTFTDGLMDTADGIFSGRDRERMLAIMKDSRVGSNGVIAFTMAALLKVALYGALPRDILPLSVFCLPIVTRTFLVFAITCFKSARPEGLGELFARHASQGYAWFALLFAALLLAPVFTPLLALASAACFLCCFLAARRVASILGGLTGDTYGFLAETGSIFFLLFVYFGNILLNKGDLGF
jgi:adenosylcobinamide-GDP ribazoletransferase